ncbi:MAG TPA: histidine phosphatase family protein [Thermodesulfovibrionales bacterium]|nr:histidine phosphatase family protein [Thermodesulfovibrionales bacterium]
MVTTLYLVRHGETEGSGVKRYHGSIDVPISERGIRQLRDASAFIRGYLKTLGASRRSSYLREVHRVSEAASGCGVREERLQAVYCSDLSRAVRSAEIIAEPYALQAMIIPDFRERNFGVWEGMTFTEIKEAYPSEFESWAGNPLRYNPPGGENTVEVKERVCRALDRVLSSHPEENIAVVAHGGVNRIILCHLLGVPLENIFRIEQDYGAVNVIEFWERYPVVKLMNRGAHE